MSTRSSIYLALVLLCGAVAPAQDSKFFPQNQQIPVPDCLAPKGFWQAPCTAADHETWLNDIQHWRAERRIRIGYNGDRYAIPEQQWTQSSFIQPQMMAHERYFFDPVAGKYTVNRYLDDLEKRYGGIDAVLIWPTYPNMGIDNRNQHDLIRCMPGGVAGVRQMVADFHKRGVRVLFPMMLWDQGTRKPDKSWPEEIASLMKEIGADGVNGDTQDGVPLAFTLAADRVGHPLVFQPEIGPSDEAVAWDLMTWGQYQYPFAPLVDRYKWLEPRHMVNISDRSNRSKTNNLQFAFFNGVGWESWENVWGIWNGVTPRDGEATRRVAKIERAIAAYLVSPDWEPLSPMLRYGVFASKWPAGERTAWTIVNRNEYDTDGAQMEIPAGATRFFDLYHGVELKPGKDPAGKMVLSFPIEAKGYGAIFAANGEPPAKIQKLMAEMKQLTLKPLASFSNEWKVLNQEIVPIAATREAGAAPAGMVQIPEADFLFKVQGIEIEGANDIGVDVQYPWERAPTRFHESKVHVKSFFIDKYPVTNAEFKKFTDATHYRPNDDINYLRDWKDGAYPLGWDNRPVTWVSIEDVRAYAAWAGKRLPHEWEWQYAAQGRDGRLYPWGNQWDSSAVPEPDKSRTMRGPDPVDAHPKGASVFGVTDMVGNVWQWTEEFTDSHTRAGILRGGSYYQPQGSRWYFPQAYKLGEHGKLLMMSPGMDRSGAVGFRLVQDAR